VIINYTQFLQPSLKWEATGMWSSEGEFVAYEQHVYTEGPVEVRQSIINIKLFLCPGYTDISL